MAFDFIVAVFAMLAGGMVSIRGFGIPTFKPGKLGTMLQI
jgi:hypothetical protein